MRINHDLRSHGRTDKTTEIKTFRKKKKNLYTHAHRHESDTSFDGQFLFEFWRKRRKKKKWLISHYIYRRFWLMFNQIGVRQWPRGRRRRAQGQHSCGRARRGARGVSPITTLTFASRTGRRPPSPPPAAAAPPPPPPRRWKCSDFHWRTDGSTDRPTDRPNVRRIPIPIALSPFVFL